MFAIGSKAAWSLMVHHVAYAYAYDCDVAGDRSLSTTLYYRSICFSFCSNERRLPVASASTILSVQCSSDRTKIQTVRTDVSAENKGDCGFLLIHESTHLVLRVDI